MGGYVSYVKSERDTQVSQPQLVKLPKETQVHELTEDPKVGLVCSCGYFCSTKHIFNLHVEHHVGLSGTMDPSGWPERQFETVPYVGNTQRGVVARGDIPHSLFTTIFLNEDYDVEVVKKVLAAIPDLNSRLLSESSTKDPTAHLVSFVAVSNSVWTKIDRSPPKELKDFEDILSAKKDVVFPSTGGHIFLMAKSTTRQDLCYELALQVLIGLGPNVARKEQTFGFRYMGGRDLTGFIDGTRNPDHLLRALVDVTVIFPDDDTTSHEGGSYMYAGKYVHNLPKFHDMSNQEKSEIVGRQYHVVSPHKGYDTRPENPRMENAPKSSHVERGHGPIYRQAYPFVEKDNSGLYFCAFSRSLVEIDRILKRMAGHEAEDGSLDNLFKITRSIENNYYYCPSLSELRNLDAENEQVCVLPQHLVSAAYASKMEIDSSIPRKKIFIEYCTNCGYRTIFLEMKVALQTSFPVEVIGNPTMPRLSAFEVVTEDGKELWSKLKQPDGRNNFPHVFPKAEVLVREYHKHLGETEEKSDNNDTDAEVKLPEKQSIYTTAGTRVGVW